MTYLEAILLGVVQGLTEFLPISSSGHLVIGQKLLGLEQAPVFFDILVHGGTLAAIVVFFRRQLIKFFSSWRNWQLVFIASLPAGIIGLILDRYTEVIFNSLLVVGVGLLVTGCLLWLTKYFTVQKASRLNFKSALLIGSFQALAILPGISRSGATISAALISGLGQQQAFSFSFFLAIPAILAALFLQFLSFTAESASWRTMYSGNFFTGLLGFMVAALVGYFSLKLLQQILKTARFHRFAYYCLCLAILAICLPYLL